MTTALQIQMITRIARSEFTTVNGATPATLADVGEIWICDIVEDAQDKGVLVSLHNAGLVGMSGGKDGVVWLTPAGFAAFVANAA